MQIEKIVKPSFSVIGKQGSTADGAQFVAALWADANAHFSEIAHLAKKHEDGSLAGIWGAMSDFSMNFMPWEEEFSKGLYLAGVECAEDAEAPEGWVKWTVPGFEYLKNENDQPDSFVKMIGYMKENNLPLAGAAQDYTDPATGKNYTLFPVRRL